jgi:hypothetical protein
MIEVIFVVIVERNQEKKKGTGVRWLLYIINETFECSQLLFFFE